MLDISKLRVLDPIFFENKNKKGQSINLDLSKQQSFGNDEFSHIGFIISAEYLPELDELEKNELYVWEFKLLETNNLEKSNDRLKYACRIRSIDDIIADGDSIAWSPLRLNPLYDYKEKEYAKIVKAKVLKMLKKLHTTRVRKWFLCCRRVISAFRKITERSTAGKAWLMISEIVKGIKDSFSDSEWVFGSEIPLMFYQELQLLPEDLDVINFDIMDFVLKKNDFIQGPPEYVDLESKSTKITDTKQNIFEQVKDIAEEVISAKPLDTIKEIIDEGKGVFSELADTVSKVKDVAAEVVDTGKGVFSELSDTVSKVKEDLVEKAKDVEEIVIDVGESAIAESSRQTELKLHEKLDAVMKMVEEIRKEIL